MREVLGEEEKKKGGREVGSGGFKGRERGGEGGWEEDRKWERGEKGGRERTYIVLW